LSEQGALTNVGVLTAWKTFDVFLNELFLLHHCPSLYPLMGIIKLLKRKDVGTRALTPFLSNKAPTFENLLHMM